MVVVAPKAASIRRSPQPQTIFCERSDFTTSNIAEVSRFLQLACFHNHEIIDAVDVEVAMFASFRQGATQISLDLALAIQH